MRQSKVTPTVDETIRQLLVLGKLTDAEANELRRLPKISDARARELLGPLADAIATPPDLPKLADPCPPESVPDSPSTNAASDRAVKPCRS